jgi:hypothetical protein
MNRKETAMHVSHHAPLGQLLGQAIDQHAALLYLLREWDVNAPPHELHAQFTAIEACARNTEALLGNALEVADASPGPAASPAPDLPGARAAAGPLPSDIDNAIYDVAYLTALVNWIEGARLVVDAIESGRQHYPDLEAALQAHEIRSGIPWEEEESAGLQTMMRSIRETVAALGPKHVADLSEEAAAR